MLNLKPFRGNLQKYSILKSQMHTVGMVLIVIDFCAYRFENLLVNKKVMTDFLPEFLGFAVFFEVATPIAVT